MSMNRIKGKKQPTHNRSRRRAAAVVEMAVVTPLLLTMIFGIIEYGWVFMVRQTMTNAAREGARTAVLQVSTDADIIARVNESMVSTGLTGYDIDITHGTLVDPVETVTLTIPYADVSLLGGFFGPKDFDIGATASMRKEGVTQQEE